MNRTGLFSKNKLIELQNTPSGLRKMVAKRLGGLKVRLQHKSTLTGVGVFAFAIGVFLIAIELFLETFLLDSEYPIIS